MCCSAASSFYSSAPDLEDMKLTRHRMRNAMVSAAIRWTPIHLG
jgi:hypothetical protein